MKTGPEYGEQRRFSDAPQFRPLLVIGRCLEQ